MFLRAKNIIKRVSKNRDVNPLTKLSGNTEIEEQMTYEIEHIFIYLFVIRYLCLDLSFIVLFIPLINEF